MELDTAEKKAMMTVSVVETPVHRLQADRAPTAVLEISPYVLICSVDRCVFRSLSGGRVPWYALVPCFPVFGRCKVGTGVSFTETRQ
jgi:hypothetical protein